MKKLYSIGETAKIKKTTVKTLRFYDRIGLLKPRHIDPVTNYRYYSADQFLRIEYITSFRRMGASLKEISAALAQYDPGKLADFCRRQSRAARHQISLLNQSVQKFEMLEERIRQCQAAADQDAVYRRPIETRTIITRPCTTEPADERTYNIYFDVYNQIREKNLLSIYATGSIVSLGREGPALNYRAMFVEVLAPEEVQSPELSQLPAGDYLCVSYYQHTRTAQLSKIQAELDRLGRTPRLVVEADTFIDIVDYVNPLMELQILL